MYLEHFSLNLMPFTLSPDSRFLFSSSSHLEALNTLLVAVKNREGFIKITGEVGLGKTLLCREFIHRLPEHARVIYIPNPYLRPVPLLRAIAEELELRTDSNDSEHSLVSQITRRLLGLHDQGKQVILCLDEAQSMPLETLEAMRLLTNIETETEKLLCVVLFGQPELDRKLSQHSIRQLAQRIVFQCRLRPMTKADTAHYLDHRVLVAGASRTLFAPLAKTCLHWASAGVPRLTNILAHKSLMLSYGRGLQTVNAQTVLLAALDTPAIWRVGVFPRATFASLLLAFTTALVWRLW